MADEFAERSMLGGSRVAIVGMAGRGPGSDDLAQFWDIVMSQRRLHKFSAADYLADLSPIFSRFFGPMLPARVVSKIPDGWI